MSPIAHSACGLLGWELCSARKNIKTLVLFVAVACFPDIDYVLYLILGKSRLFIHQYYTHNLFFVLITGAAFAAFLKMKKERLGLMAVALSHLVLDVFVIDNLRPVGIQFFYPLSSRLFNLGIFPYLLRGSLRQVFSLRNLFVLLLEVVMFLLPVVVITRKKLRYHFKKREFWKIS